MNERILVDIGSNMGNTINYLTEKRGPFDKVYAFEPDPFHHANYEENMPDVNLIRKAVWVYDGTMELNVYGHEDVQDNEELQRQKDVADIGIGGYGADDGWSSLYKKAGMREEAVVRVDCVDLSKWLLDNLESENYNVVKMDIEGAEFKTLNHALDNGGLELVDELYVEHHKNRYAQGRLGTFVRDEEWLEKHGEDPWAMTTLSRRLHRLLDDRLKELVFDQADIRKYLE